VSTLRRPLTALRLPAAGAVLALALTGCGATLDAQTYQERSQSDATNTAVGTIALRGLSIESGGADRTLSAGDDAEVFLVLTNDDDEDDTLVEVTTPAAESVELLVDGEESDGIEVPRLGSTGDSATLRLVGLTEDLREGEYTTMTFRFERNGTLDEVPVPVRTSGRTDRPVYTGGEGEEGEPALQAPAGGHGGEEAGGDEGGAGAEGEEGIVGEGEGGQSEDEGETAPRDEESTTNETSEEEPGASPSPSG
jgi:copper(I)-binding protein